MKTILRHYQIATILLATLPAFAQQPATPAIVEDPPAAQQPAAQPAAQEPAAQQPAAQPTTDQPITQEPLPDDQGGFVFKKQVQEVVLHATVVDETQRLVPYLDRGAFAISQNGVPQTITSFHREDVPVALGIVIDNSGSMLDKREKVNQAVLNLVRASNPKDEVFVVNFSQNYYLDQDFTSDINLLETALHQVSTRGSTALYDAVVASAVHLKNNPRLDKKVILLVTDGQDNMSQETLAEAQRRLQQSNGATIYAIGLSGAGLTTAAREALQSLATSTGGAAFFPQSLDEVNNITRSIAHDIRSQYALAYDPSSQKPGIKPGYQTIHVEARANNAGKLTVRTRNGYYSGEAAQ